MSVWKFDGKLLILESLISPTKILLFEKYYLQCIRHNVPSQDETHRSSSKNTALCVVFLTLFSVFDLVMKHCVYTLDINYYIKFQIKYLEGSRSSAFLGFG